MVCPGPDGTRTSASGHRPRDGIRSPCATPRSCSGATGSTCSTTATTWDATASGTRSWRRGSGVIRVERYEAGAERVWNTFVAAARNGVFLFDRRYMDYHAERFVDASLLFYEDDALVGLLPANLTGDTLVSHAGLTFGGVVCSARMEASLMGEV